MRCAYVGMHGSRHWTSFRVLIIRRTETPAFAASVAALNVGYGYRNAPLGA